jgi:hypothetical protein
MDTSDWPNVASERERRVLKGRLEGVQIGNLGRRERFAQDVRLVVQCEGGRCPPRITGDVLMFLRVDGRRYTARTAPCGGDMFWKPVPEAMRLLQSCLDGRSCPSGQQLYDSLVKDRDPDTIAPWE